MILVYRFAGDVAELGIIRAGKLMGVNVILNPRVHLVYRYNFDTIFNHKMHLGHTQFSCSDVLILINCALT